MVRRSIGLVWLCAMLLAGCGQPADEAGDTSESESGTSETGEVSTYTWWRDVAPIVATKCATCHDAGQIGPFSLATYEEVLALAPLLGPSIEAGSMPPWPPDAACNDYRHDRSLDEHEREVLLTWLAEGLAEGNPEDAPPEPEPEPAWDADLDLEMPEAYTPTQVPDDYRCFMLDGPPGDQSSFITGFDARPGQPSMVHHVIAFIVGPEAVAEYEALDASDPGPGWTCFGGPGGADDLLVDWAGQWTPGTVPWQAPAGTGIEVEPGSRLILQVHYNLSGGAPLADRSAIELQLAESVERPAMILPYTDIAWIQGTTPMTIPAGEPSVVHSLEAERDHPILNLVLARIGVLAEDELWLSNAALHMHLLGRRASLVVEHPEADECLLRIDDYDFNWQGSFTLDQPITFGPGDRLILTCEWDNSAENQPIIDGVQGEPVDASWGDGSGDEMCAGLIYVSKAG